MLAFIGAHSLPLAAIALAGYLVLGAIMPIASSKLCGNAGRASRDAAGSISAYVLDGLRGLAETVQFAGVSKRSAGLAAQTDAMGSTDRSLHVRSAAVEGLADAMVLLTSLAMIATSLGLYAAGDLSFSSAFICSFAYLSSFGPVLAVCRLGTSLQATLASGARVLDLLDEGPQTVDVADGADVSFGGAACEHVTFSYGVRGVSEARGALRGSGAHIADRKVASGIRHPGCGAGRFPVRRRTPAHRPCAHLLARCSVCAAGRAHQQPGRTQRSGGYARDRSPPRRQNGGIGKPSSVYLCICRSFLQRGARTHQLAPVGCRMVAKSGPIRYQRVRGIESGRTVIAVCRVLGARCARR